jgi:hypothetical protein
MRHKGLLTIGILVLVASSSLYVIYSSMQAGEAGGPTHSGLESLLDAGQGVNVRDLEGEERDNVTDALQGLPEWTAVLGFLGDKGFEIDPSTMEIQETLVMGFTVHILRIRTARLPTGVEAEVVLASDCCFNTAVWVTESNLPSDSFFDVFYEVELPTSSEVPVTVWSNGLPVFYITVYHWIGGIWMPYHYWWHEYHYWWHESENHPNWYYSYYYWWWWYYDWWGYYWIPWFDWFFGWYYYGRFYYWSTYFPIGEPFMGLLFLLPVLPAYEKLRRRRREVPGRFREGS